MVKPNQPRGRPKQSSDVPLTGSRALDPNSSVPLYFQLAAALKATLETGAWPAGARFASEREINEEFGVSSTVITRALELLVGDGAIVRRKGKGAFVAPPRSEVAVRGLVRLLLDPPDDGAITILSVCKHHPADHIVARFLEVEDQKAPIAHVTAVIDPGQPSVCLIDSYCPAGQLPWVLSAAEALQAGSEPPAPGKVELTRATAAIEHTFFGEWGSSQVGASAGDPALMGRVIQFGRAKGAKRERPLEFARLFYRADSAHVAFDLG